MIATEEAIRMLFGSVPRFQFGMWVAGLPNDPHYTFTRVHYWEFCRERNLPGEKKSVRAYLNRFEMLDMVFARADMNEGYRIPEFWTKRPSPLWEIYRMAEASFLERAELGELPRPRYRRYKPSPGRQRAAADDLMRLDKELRDGGAT